MISLTPEDLKNFEENLALFFNENCELLINTTNNNPYIVFSQGSKHFDINNAVLDNDLIIAQGAYKERSAFSMVNPKHFLSMADSKLQGALLRAIHWVSWDQKTKYCSSCGGVLQKTKDVAEKQCTICSKHFYSNLAPAVMMLIKRDRQILLARSSDFTSGMYAPLAGFVDIGETIEDAIHREVFEEVGLKVHNLTYFGSQSWPFPGSFMIAFTADYLDCEISIDNKEIEDAQWFDVDNLPELPPASSIARSLIENTINTL